MTKEKKVLRSTFTGTLNIIESLFGYPWDIKDRRLYDIYYAINSYCVDELNWESDDEEDN